MRYIKGLNRHQSLMFPELLDDYIDENNPVRFIDVFVDGLDLKKLGFTHTHDDDLMNYYELNSSDWTFLT